MPSSPHPVIERGHNLPGVLAEATDVEDYLSTLAELEREYQWSSDGQHVGERAAYPWVDTGPCGEALGAIEQEREKRYQAFGVFAVPVGEWERRGEAVQALVGRRTEHRQPERPRKRAEK